MKKFICSVVGNSLSTTNPVEFANHIISQESYDLICEISAQKAISLEELTNNGGKCLYIVRTNQDQLDENGHELGAVGIYVEAVLAVRTNTGVLLMNNEEEEPLAIEDGDIIFEDIKDAFRMRDALINIYKGNKEIERLSNNIDQIRKNVVTYMAELANIVVG